MVRGRARREEGHPSPVGSLGAAGGWDFPENLPPASAPFVTVVSRWSRAEVEVEVHCVILTRAMLHSRWEVGGGGGGGGALRDIDTCHVA